MIEVSAIHIADRAELFAELAALVAGDDRNGPGAMRGCQLYRLCAQATRATPDENDIVLLENVALPPKQHAIGRSPDQRGSGGFLPCQPRRLRHHLV